MTIELRELPPERFGKWMDDSSAEFASDLIATGVAPEVARERADRVMVETFPDGVPAGGHIVSDIFASDERVGYIWVGPSTGAEGEWWLWDVVVDPQHRRKGYARAAIAAAESQARNAGASALGLNVFGLNRGAQALYESLGFEVTAMQMRKRLT